MKRTKVMATAVLALSAMLLVNPAMAEDQRTSDQGNTTVRFVSKVASPTLDSKIKTLAKMLGVKISHPTSKVWKVTAKPTQIQTMQKMLGGMGLTLKSNK
jgi:ABC-type phosphate/phosphonate transport system substrate-binding protein